MKKIKISFGAILLGTLLSGFQGCKKNDPAVKNSAQQNVTANSDNQSSRMWISGTMYAVGNDIRTHLTTIFTVLPPPGAGYLTPAFYATPCVGGVPVTYATGIAFTATSPNKLIVISTGPTSNFPNKLLTYIVGGTFLNPTTTTPVAPGITDIEFNEYDGKLYGILANSTIVSILGSVITTNLPVPHPGGTKVIGLCNYNGLLSYCISDVTTGTADPFYSYNPSSPGITSPLFSVDFQTGDGGAQFCNAYGWQIATEDNFKNSVAAVGYAISGVATLGGKYYLVDLSSETNP